VRLHLVLDAAPWQAVLVRDRLRGACAGSVVSGARQRWGRRSSRLLFPSLARTPVAGGAVPEPDRDSPGLGRHGSAGHDGLYTVSACRSAGRGASS